MMKLSSHSGPNEKATASAAEANRTASRTTMGPPAGLPPSQARPTYGGVMEKMYFKSPIPISVRKIFNNQQAGQSVNDHVPMATTSASFRNVRHQAGVGPETNQVQQEQNKQQQPATQKLSTCSHILPGKTNFPLDHKLAALGIEKKAIIARASEANPEVSSEPAGDALQIRSGGVSDNLLKNTNVATMNPADMSRSGQEASRTTNNGVIQEALDKLDTTSNLQAASLKMILEVGNSASGAACEINARDKKRLAGTDISSGAHPSKVAKSSEAASPLKQDRAGPTSERLSTGILPEASLAEEWSSSLDAVLAKKKTPDSLTNIQQLDDHIISPILPDLRKLEQTLISPATPAEKSDAAKSLESIKPAKSHFVTTNGYQNSALQKKANIRKGKARNSLDTVWKNQLESERKIKGNGEENIARRRSGRASLLPREWWRVGAEATERKISYQEIAVGGLLRKAKSDTQLSKSIKEPKEGNGKGAQINADSKKSKETQSKHDPGENEKQKEIEKEVTQPENSQKATQLSTTRVIRGTKEDPRARFARKTSSQSPNNKKKPRSQQKSQQNPSCPIAGGSEGARLPAPTVGAPPTLSLSVASGASGSQIALYPMPTPGLPLHVTESSIVKIPCRITRGLARRSGFALPESAYHPKRRKRNNLDNNNNGNTNTKNVSNNTLTPRSSATEAGKENDYTFSDEE